MMRWEGWLRLGLGSDSSVLSMRRPADSSVGFFLFKN